MAVSGNRPEQRCTVPRFSIAPVANVVRKRGSPRAESLGLRGGSRIVTGNLSRWANVMQGLQRHGLMKLAKDTEIADLCLLYTVRVAVVNSGSIK